MKLTYPTDKLSTAKMLMIIENVRLSVELLVLLPYSVCELSYRVNREKLNKTDEAKHAESVIVLKLLDICSSIYHTSVYTCSHHGSGSRYYC